ncbi:MAG TPA: hypothetical protein VFU63_05815 [Ktedonobacterales bacterium]|nr:hypothetical protein [Ktedonobacterales bacterium]
MSISGEAPTSHDPYRATGQTPGGALPLLELGAVRGRDSSGAGGLLGALIEIIGVEGSSLYGVLTAWQREQDRLTNRAWRRPGGMARPAGL